MANLTLTKEQASALLPLLPSLLAKEPAEVSENQESFSIEAMLEKKAKNTASTRAQNYLLVSYYCLLISSVYLFKKLGG